MTNEEVNPIISAAGKNSKGILVTEESNGDKTNTKIFEIPKIFTKVHNNINFFVLTLNKAHIEYNYEFFKTKYDTVIINKLILEKIWNNRETPYKYKDLNFGFLLLHNDFFKKALKTVENLKIEKEKKNLPLDTNTIERIIQANIYINMPHFMKTSLNVNLTTNSGQIYKPGTLVNKKTTSNYQDVDDLYKKFCHFFILEKNIEVLRLRNNTAIQISVTQDDNKMNDLHLFLSEMYKALGDDFSLEIWKNHKNSINETNDKAITKKYGKLFENFEENNFGDIFQNSIAYFALLFYNTICNKFGFTEEENEEEEKKYIASKTVKDHDDLLIQLTRCYNYITKYIDDEHLQNNIDTILNKINAYLNEIDKFRVERYCIVRDNKDSKEDFDNVRDNKNEKTDFDKIISSDIFDYKLMNIEDKIHLYKKLFEELGTSYFYQIIGEKNIVLDTEEIDLENQFSIIDKINYEYINKLVEKLQKCFDQQKKNHLKNYFKHLISEFFIILIESENINHFNKKHLFEKLESNLNENAIEKYDSYLQRIDEYIVPEKKIDEFLYEKNQHLESSLIKRNRNKKAHINNAIQIEEKYLSFYLNYLNNFYDIYLILDKPHILEIPKDKKLGDILTYKIEILNSYSNIYTDNINNKYNINNDDADYKKFYNYFKTSYNRLLDLCNNILNEKWVKEDNTDNLLPKNKKKVLYLQSPTYQLNE